ncbi:Nitrogen fixation regulatory protein [Symmachiella dynata]|uniref:histidine kinase n=1 Tax=Symmachiella dynata TaxID=2527995 RepID=A0A517ZGV8_9PLAN|nr:sensor histidine kinase [Symmachiella dynata]QDU41713.1 Nitrogen fixation regulatory protein [Symmachiella dynata]
MTIARIRFAPDILRRLGEELNPHPAVGIIELVKNAYDADARKCTVTLTDVDDAGGQVEISDNGDGMTVEQIKHGWLVLGHSQKEKNHRTRLGRIPAGSKGLGRLAALRLGRFAHLETRPRSRRDAAYELLIDWKLFDTASLIDDVDLAIDVRARKKGTSSGTTIRLDKQRDRIGRLEVKRLARAMLLLADPFGENTEGFQPKLVAPEFSDLEALVKRRYFDHASYHLVARLNKKGLATAQLHDARGEILFSSKHTDLFPKNDEQTLECPPVEFELWTFLLNGVTFAPLPVTIQEVKAWLAEFGGVHIYQNGLRVAPYGDAGHDWLSLNVARARSPEERPSTNNSIGRVRLEDSEEILVQKTDRSGFIESHAFHEIRRFAQAALDWMADRRMELAEKRRAKARTSAPKRTSKTKKRLDETIEAAPPKLREQLREAADRHDKSRDKEVEGLKKEVQLYRTLSTAGITAATFAHESTGNPLKVIRASIGTIERRAKELFGKDYKKKLDSAVERVKSSVESLGVLDTVTLSLLSHEKRRLAKVDVHQVINGVLQMFHPFLAVRQVIVDLDLTEGSPWLHGSEAAIESIITNLVNNSLVALEEKAPTDRKIRVSTTVNEDVLRLVVIDSGDGIKDIRASDIWLPGKSTRKNGTGLGLTIVKDTVLDLGGNVGVLELSPLGGAEIFVELPIVGA